MKGQTTCKAVVHYGISTAIFLPYNQMQAAILKHLMKLRFNGQARTFMLCTGNTTRMVIAQPTAQTVIQPFKEAMIPIQMFGNLTN
jgi:hypothetical protein